MKKVSLSPFLVIVVIAALALSGRNFVLAHASNDVNSVIMTSDTTWTKANSPYTLAGPIRIGEGVTMTVQPGVTVNLNGFDLQVEGTLRAVGTRDDPIQIHDGEIEFTENSANWNEQTGKGCIIENAILDLEQIRITNTSQKINLNILYGEIEIDLNGAPIISNNNFIGKYHNSGIDAVSGSPIILNNTFSSSLIVCHNNAIISNNIINGKDNGKGISASNSYVSDNVITGCADYGIDAVHNTTIERNLITDCGKGIWAQLSDVTIRNNTIVDNQIGILVENWITSINDNNIHNNSEYNIRLTDHAIYDIDATNNWWGTTDRQAISQKIYDNKNNFNLGKVTFEPFLTVPTPPKHPS